MFWQTPLLFLGVLGAVCNAAPVVPLEGDITGVEGATQNFTVDGLDGNSLDKRFTVTYVFRADKRSPAQLKQSGFLPKGYTSKTAIKEDVSLYRHVIGAASGFSMDNDGYVSTTSSQAVAEGWITKFLGGSGYTYKIATYANLIDVQETLKAYNKYPEEKEFAALKVIPWDQVIGWAQFDVTKHGVVKGVPTANPNYNAAKYHGKAHAGAQYGLAGFPNQHKAWNEDPWYFYTHCRPAARSAEEIFAREVEETDAGEISAREVEETDADEIVARGRVKSSKKKTSSTRKHKTTPKKGPKKPTKAGTKCTATMAKAGKCKQGTAKCTAAMKKAGKCGTEKCSAADEKAGKCCSAASKKAGKCKKHDCGPTKTNQQAAQEYWNEIQKGTTPKPGSHPKSAGKKGTKVRNKSGKRIGS